MFSSFTRHIALIGFVLSLLVLAACGDSRETTPESRAFVAFLQTQIVDQPGVNVPSPDESEMRSFGPYAADYRVIADFTVTMDREMENIRAFSALAHDLKSLENLRDRWRDVATLRERIAATTGTVLAEQVAKANAAKAALKQPDIVQAVYDKAFARTVTQPAKAVQDYVPALLTTIDAMVEIGRFLDENRETARINGLTIEPDDDATLQERFRILIGRYGDSVQQLAGQSGNLERLLAGGQ